MFSCRSQELLLQSTLNVKGGQNSYTFPSGVANAIILLNASDQNNVPERWHFSGTGCTVSVVLTLNSTQRYEKILRVSDISAGAVFNVTYDYGYSATAYIIY